MKIVDGKSNVMRWVIGIYQRHGDGIDIEIKTQHRVTRVRFIVFDNGEVAKESQFNIYLGADYVQDFVEQKTEEALRKVGAEFISLHDLEMTGRV